MLSAATTKFFKQLIAPVPPFVRARRSLRIGVHLGAALLIAQLLASSTFGQSTAPAVASSVGYLNEQPLLTHTTELFDSRGTSTLVAFVGSHPTWNGLPVSISGLTDNLNNSWNVLTGPTIWSGSVNTLLGAIYYVNAPATSSTFSVTINLTNPAPLVIHVFAVSGTDFTALPIYSTITD